MLEFQLCYHCVTFDKLRLWTSTSSYVKWKWEEYLALKTVVRVKERSTQSALESALHMWIIIHMVGPDLHNVWFVSGLG